MTDFGRGQILRQSSRFLRDPDIRRKRILEAAERDSVIEGLPPFTPEFKENLLKELTTGTA